MSMLGGSRHDAISRLLIFSMRRNATNHATRRRALIFYEAVLRLKSSRVYALPRERLIDQRVGLRG